MKHTESIANSAAADAWVEKKQPNKVLKLTAHQLLLLPCRYSSAAIHITPTGYPLLFWS